MVSASVLQGTNWRWIAVRAVVAFVFGVLALAVPGITVAALVTLFGAYALVDGVFTLVAAFTMGRSGWNSVAWGLAGLLGIGAGLVTFFWPGITAVALLYVVAAWALVTGVFEIAAAISMRKAMRHEWLIGLSGLVSIVLGLILLAVRPVDGLVAIVWVLGWYALFASGVLASKAWQLRKLGPGRGSGAGSAWMPGAAPTL
jgi:uncharacterized membrane protein HdeD (DUF308 family)